MNRWTYLEDGLLYEYEWMGSYMVNVIFYLHILKALNLEERVGPYMDRVFYFYSSAYT